MSNSQANDKLSSDKLLETLSISDANYSITEDAELLEKIDINSMQLRQPPNSIIDLDGLFDSTINIIDTYYVCVGCGHIYWVKTYWLF